MIRRSKGSILIPHGVDVWPHELRTAQVLAHYGRSVEFIVNNRGYRIKTADIFIDGEAYEIKSPKANKLSAVERNLKRATKQSPNIVLVSRRMGKVRDETIQKLLIQKFKQQKTIRNPLFINRKHELIDIGEVA